MQFLAKENSGENSTFRPLAYPGLDSILDSQSSPTYEIVFSIHCFTGLIMCSITMLAYSLAATFVVPHLWTNSDTDSKNARFGGEQIEERCRA